MDDNAVRNFAATFVTDTTNPPTPRHRRLRRGRFDLVEIADVVTALICFAIANSVLTNGTHHHTGLIVLLAVLNCAPVALRTRYPLTAWVASALAIIVTSLQVSTATSSGYLALVVFVNGLCLYAVAVRCQPRITFAVTAVTIVVASFLDAGSTVVAIFLIAVPLLLGVVVRVRRSGARQLEEQERRHSG